MVSLIVQFNQGDALAGSGIEIGIDNLACQGDRFNVAERFAMNSGILSTSHCTVVQWLVSKCVLLSPNFDFSQI